MGPEISKRYSSYCFYLIFAKLYEGIGYRGYLRGIQRNTAQLLFLAID